MRNCLRVVAVLFLFRFGVCTGQVLINEVMASNDSCLSDEDGDSSDWIELFNDSAYPSELGGWALTDDPLTPRKWIFPEGELGSGEFLIIFASGKNRSGGWDSELHANFKIDRNGESIFLLDENGILRDSVLIDALPADYSYGRHPDGAGNWGVFSDPTPGSGNLTGSYPGFSETVNASLPAGIYLKALTVALRADAGSVIHYTLDGSEPGSPSRVYSVPLRIDTSTVLRARTFRTGMLPGPILTASYIIREKTHLPVVSLSTGPDNLFDDDIGIYVKGNGTAMGGYPDNPVGPPANYWEDWERPVHIEFFEPDAAGGFSEDAGLAMHGKTTRNLPQKSFAVFFRGRYGASSLDYAVFPGLSVERFASLVLRNAGTDNTVNEGGVHFRDGLAATLARGLDLDVQAYRPCILYLNGAYWGLYNIREKLNEDYLASHHGVDPERLDILDDYHTLYPLVVEGDAGHYNALIDYLQSHPLDSAPDAGYVKTQMDVDNYLTYMAVQIFIANQDGPGHNCKFWRPASPGGRYRWLLYDTDHAFGMRLFVPYYHFDPEAYLDNTIAYYREENGPSWPNPPESTFLFRKILESPEFRDAFINRLADLMNTCFSQDSLEHAIEETAGRLGPEMERHLARWGGSPARWMSDVEVVRDFGRFRGDALREHLAGEFGLAGTAGMELRISPPGAGGMKINSFIPDSYPWSGVYFRGLPISVTALPAPGHRFSGWTGINGNSSRVSMDPSEGGTATACFEASDGPACAVVINEINYRSSSEFDAGDWVELYNPYSAPVDLSGWVLRDENPSNGFVFPPGTSMEADGYLVCCSDIRALRTLFPEVKNAAGDMDFGLDSRGEHILLIDPFGHVADSLTYGSRAPWPEGPDGGGPSLALRAPDLDNSFSGNWAASAGSGTPGRSNEFPGQTAVEEIVPPSDFSLLPNVPNPFGTTPSSGPQGRPGTSIRFNLARSSRVALRIYDVRGRLVRDVPDGAMGAGLNQIPWDGRDSRGLPVPCGIYICRMDVGDAAGPFRRKITAIK